MVSMMEEGQTDGGMGVVVVEDDGGVLIRKVLPDMVTWSAQ
jgi:hypothetical protein